MVIIIYIKIIYNHIYHRMPATGAYVSNLLSNITWNSDHTSVISASAYMTTWILRMPENDSHVNNGGSYVDPIAESWEKEFIELIATDSGYIVGILKHLKKRYLIEFVAKKTL